MTTITREITSTLETFPDIIQGTDEWLEQRRGMITASAIGQLLTVRPFGAMEYDCPACDVSANEPCRSKVKRAGVTGAAIKTAHPERAAVAVANRQDDQVVLEVASNDTSLSLTALLAAERITGHVDPTYVSDDMLRGTEDEPKAVDVYSKHYAPVTTVGYMVRTWGRFRLGFSPDGLVGTDGLVEVKSRRQKKQLLTVVSDEVPPENMAQLQSGLFVSGRDWIDYISFSGGMHLWVKRVLPDPRWFEAIVAAVEQFETNATEMVTKYNAATVGMPMTERTIEMEMIL